MKDKVFLDVLNHIENNEQEILKSNNCTCLYCQKTFSAREVNDWISLDGSTSARCPYCGLPFVLADSSNISLSKTFLKETHHLIFGNKNSRNGIFDFERFIDRFLYDYEAKIINHTPRNEELYLKYLEELGKIGYDHPYLALADFYLRGGNFQKKDIHKAYKYLKNPALKNNGVALDYLGLLYANGDLGKVYKEKAYKSFALGMALDDKLAQMHFFDCYASGISVKKDVGMAIEGYFSLFRKAFNRFRITNGEEDGTYLMQIAKRLAIYLYEPVNNRPGPIEVMEHFSALFSLIALYALSLSKDETMASYDFEKDKKELLSFIKDTFGDYFTLSKDVEFDENTFMNSSVYPFFSSFLPFGSAKIKDFVFNKNENTLDFVMSYSYPPLIIDVLNHYCRFEDKEIHWSFTDVSKFKLRKNVEIKDICGGISDGAFYFFDSPNLNNRKLIGEIHFNPVEIEGEEIEERKA